MTLKEVRVHVGREKEEETIREEEQKQSGNI